MANKIPVPEWIIKLVGEPKPFDGDIWVQLSRVMKALETYQENIEFRHETIEHFKSQNEQIYQTKTKEIVQELEQRFAQTLIKTKAYSALVFLENELKIALSEVEFGKSLSILQKVQCLVKDRLNYDQMYQTQAKMITDLHVEKRRLEEEINLDTFKGGLMSWSEVKDPNVDQVSTSASYNPIKPTKRWVDRRANDPQNEEEFFTYRKLVRDNAGRTVVEAFLLSREDAGEANIPTAELVAQGSPAELAKWNPQEIPLPVRRILPDESVSLDPFNNILLQKPGEAPAKSSDFTEVNEKLDRILKKIGA